MKQGVLIHAVRFADRDLHKIVNAGQLKGKGNQYLPPQFKGEHVVNCSFYCPGYEGAYHEDGVIIETNAKPSYACPADTIKLMRECVYLPGHEQFLFPSVEAMLDAYPTSMDFKRAFREFFASLDPAVVFPNIDLVADPKEVAAMRRFYGEDFEPLDGQRLHKKDPVFHETWLRESLNELGFSGTIDIKVVDTFRSMDELREKAARLMH